MLRDIAAIIITLAILLIGSIWFIHAGMGKLQAVLSILFLVAYLQVAAKVCNSEELQKIDESGWGVTILLAIGALLGFYLIFRFT